MQPHVVASSFTRWSPKPGWPAFEVFSTANGKWSHACLNLTLWSYLLQAMPDKSDTPSNFTLKLRKHLRTRRVEEVRQLGVDRVVDFVFGTGPATYHLIMEMYSQVTSVLI